MVPQSEHDGLDSIAVIMPTEALPIVVFGLRELRVVQQVERLDAELGLDVPDPRVLDQRGVDVERARARGSMPRRVSP